MAQSPGRVLVVDDSDVIRRLITVNLELEGFEVVGVGDGQECLSVVHEVDPDVVTLDVLLPRLDGFRTARRLREDPRSAHVKIMMITAAAQERDLTRGREAGVDAYLTKPFDPSAMVTIVRDLAAVHRAARGTSA